MPRLCYMEGMRADGNCRTCMVEIKGERVLAASCCRYPKDGMEVTTNSARAVISQKMSLELLLSDIPETSYTLNSELDLWAKKMGVGKPRSTLGRNRSRTCRIRRWPCTSTPASSASAASARAAKSRSTTSSVMRSEAVNRRSSSTSTIRWATRRASLAASACRRARRAR